MTQYLFGSRALTFPSRQGPNFPNLPAEPEGTLIPLVPSWDTLPYMTAILPWLFNLLGHAYHLALHPTLISDYEGNSKRIKGIAALRGFLGHGSGGGKIKIGQGGTDDDGPRYRGD